MIKFFFATYMSEAMCLKKVKLFTRMRSADSTLWISLAEQINFSECDQIRAIIVHTIPCNAVKTMECSIHAEAGW